MLKIYPMRQSNLIPNDPFQEDGYETMESMFRSMLQEAEDKGLLKPAPIQDLKCKQCGTANVRCSGTAPCVRCAYSDPPLNCSFNNAKPQKNKALQPLKPKTTKRAPRAKGDARKQAEGKSKAKKGKGKGSPKGLGEGVDLRAAEDEDDSFMMLDGDTTCLHSILQTEASTGASTSASTSTSHDTFIMWSSAGPKKKRKLSEANGAEAPAKRAKREVHTKVAVNAGGSSLSRSSSITPPSGSSPGSSQGKPKMSTQSQGGTKGMGKTLRGGVEQPIHTPTSGRSTITNMGSKKRKRVHSVSSSSSEAYFPHGDNGDDDFSDAAVPAPAHAQKRPTRVSRGVKVDYVELPWDEGLGEEEM